MPLYNDCQPRKWRVSSVVVTSYTVVWLYCCVSKGSLNTVTDSLSRCIPAEVPSVATQLRIDHEKEDIYNAQCTDPVIKEVQQKLCNILWPNQKGRKWYRPPLICYWWIWNQLIIADGIVCCKYSPGPSSDSITVPILPHSLQQDALCCSHDAPATGHQGIEKTLERLRRQAYRVNMS